MFFVSVFAIAITTTTLCTSLTQIFYQGELKKALVCFLANCGIYIMKLFFAEEVNGDNLFFFWSTVILGVFTLLNLGIRSLIDEAHRRAADRRNE
ncbi:hypothetical protein PFISCL1PPCAC_12080 [Pristionchus fissidentatus]|uniref:Uncharacterized protein n=1 Tax=Pristionchus fissidentatus TaxID=1538716 RepID=A0AAV5VR40_9BILA|nr:hypothetical protein PFISCL1PPCAC_12080 [Pristionchus fissidentatus]